MEMNFDPKGKIKKLFETGLFSAPSYGFMDLIGTPFNVHYYIGKNIIVWRLYNNEYKTGKYVSLEYVLENIPKELAEQLLYHLDLIS